MDCGLADGPRDPNGRFRSDVLTRIAGHHGVPDPTPSPACGILGEVTG